MHKLLLALALASALSACATAPQTRSGFLSSYQGMTAEKGAMRATVARRKLSDVRQLRSVTLEPAVYAPSAAVDWMTPQERALLLNQVDAQLCFAMSKHFALAEPGAGDGRVRAAVTLVRPTGRVASSASAAAGFFIPGPIGLRTPAGLGVLGAEAELLRASDGAQLAAVTWSRQANVVGMDTPSLSRIGDALQFAGPFAKAAQKAFAPKGAPVRKIDSQNDPCKRFGRRFRPEGFAAKLVTGLYVPDLGAANQPAGDSAKPGAADPGAGR